MAIAHNVMVKRVLARHLEMNPLLAALLSSRSPSETGNHRDMLRGLRHPRDVRPTFRGRRLQAVSSHARTRGVQKHCGSLRCFPQTPLKAGQSDDCSNLHARKAEASAWCRTATRSSRARGSPSGWRSPSRCCHSTSLGGQGALRANRALTRGTGYLLGIVLVRPITT